VAGLPAVLDDVVGRATRRDPGGRPTDAGAMLAEVQAAREDVGLAISTRAAPLAGPTVAVPRIDPTSVHGETALVPRIEPDRPGWARLRDGGPEPRRRAAGAATGAAAGGMMARLTTLVRQINSNPRGRMALAASLVAMGLLAAIGGYYFGIGRYTEAPGLVDSPREQAEQDAKRLGFEVRYGPGRYSETKAKDLVLAQDPAPGQKIVSGGTLTLTLSLGPERYIIPDVVGKRFDDAVADLATAKLVAERVDEFSDLYESGMIIKTDPPAGGEVGPNTKITVTVSKGRAPITLPRVIGQNLDQAKAALERLKLTVKVVQKQSNEPANRVIDQNPVENSGVEAGQEITLTVSTGPPEADVPDLRGRPAQEAKQILEGLGFKVRIFGNENGRVFIQNPAGGRLPQGSEIQILCA
jgi:serine/threonine-protein kinase